MANDYFTPTSLTANTKARATEVNTNLTALEAGFDKLPSPTAVKNRIADYVNATAASANTYTATLSPAPSAYVTGMQIRFTVSATNTGASTINLNSLGAKSLTLEDGTALSAGFLSTTVARTFTYDGSKFVSPADEAISVIGDGTVTTDSFASSVYASQAEAEAGTESTKIMTAQRVKQFVDANVSAAPTEFADNVFRVQDNSDATKELAFEVSGIATATTRTWTVPDANITFGAYSATLLNTADESGFKQAVNLEISTDVAPATSGTAILKGNGSGGFSSAVADTDYVAPDGSLVSFGDLDLVAGDIVYASGTDTVARLAKGSDGEVLKLASGVPSWAADSGAMVLLATDVLSADSTSEFTAFDSTLYSGYLFTFANVILSVDGSTLNLRTSSDGGSSFDSTSGDYKYNVVVLSTTTLTYVDGDSSKNLIQLCSFVGNNGSNEYGISGNLWVFGPELAADTQFVFQFTYLNNAGNIRGTSGNALRRSTSEVNAVRFYSGDGGNLTGTINMYGIKR